MTDHRLSIETAYKEFLDAVSEDELTDPEDFYETAFYAGWDYGYEQASADSCGCV